MTPDIIRKCVLIRSGLELWVEEERANKLAQVLASNNAPKFIDIEGQFVNTFEILGIFSASAMEDKQRRKNGQWKCLKGNWHDKGNVCECKENRETVTAFVEGVGEITYKK